MAGKDDVAPIDLAPPLHLLEPLKDGGDGHDTFRDTLLRYANEVGESFRMVAPGFVVRLSAVRLRAVFGNPDDPLQLPSYGVSIAYVVGDCVYQARKPREVGGPSALHVGADAFVWQMFASVLCPGLFINRVVYFSSAAVTRMPLPPPAQRFAPVALGLCTIPFIVHPIDEFVTSMMDRSLRKWFPLQ